MGGEQPCDQFKSRRCNRLAELPSGRFAHTACEGWEDARWRRVPARVLPVRCASCDRGPARRCRLETFGSATHIDLDGAAPSTVEVGLGRDGADYSLLEAGHERPRHRLVLAEAVVGTLRVPCKCAWALCRDGMLLRSAASDVNSGGPAAVEPHAWHAPGATSRWSFSSSSSARASPGPRWRPCPAHALEAQSRWRARTGGLPRHPSAAGERAPRTRSGCAPPASCLPGSTHEGM